MCVDGSECGSLCVCISLVHFVYICVSMYLDADVRCTTQDFLAGDTDQLLQKGSCVSECPVRGELGDDGAGNAVSS